jgi:hypothetical protein
VIVGPVAAARADADRAVVLGSPECTTRCAAHARTACTVGVSSPQKGSLGGRVTFGIVGVRTIALRRSARSAAWYMRTGWDVGMSGAARDWVPGASAFALVLAVALLASVPGARGSRRDDRAVRARARTRDLSVRVLDHVGGRLGGGAAHDSGRHLHEQRLVPWRLLSVGCRSGSDRCARRAARAEVPAPTLAYCTADMLAAICSQHQVAPCRSRVVGPSWRPLSATASARKAP